MFIKTSQQESIVMHAQSGEENYSITTIFSCPV
jgi:hypothetical protein